MRLFVQLSCLMPLALSLFSASASNAHHVRRHHAKRIDSDPIWELDTVYKRDFSNTRFTYYADGLGACGGTNSPDDFVCGLLQIIFFDAELDYLDSCAEFSGKIIKKVSTFSQESLNGFYLF